MRTPASIAAAAAMVFVLGCSQTDTGITTAIKSKMAADDTVKAYQIDVDTRQHVVTLTGDVDTSVAKDRAIVIARETKGVKSVKNDIRIK